VKQLDGNNLRVALIGQWWARRELYHATKPPKLSRADHRRGARIDERTTAFNLGRAIRLLFDAGDEERAWRGTPEQLGVVTRATLVQPFERYPTVASLAAAWRAARS
jgi:hypothetical protein